MGRPVPRIPFHGEAEFLCSRPMTFNGVELVLGSPVDTTGVPERVLRRLWDLKRIDVAPEGHRALVEALVAKAAPAPLPSTPPAPPAPAAGAQGGEASLGEGSEAPVSEPTPPPTGPHLARSGFGWKIHLADGTPVGQPRKDRAKAEAALAEFIKSGKAT